MLRGKLVRQREAVRAAKEGTARVARVVPALAELAMVELAVQAMLRAAEGVGERARVRALVVEMVMVERGRAVMVKGAQAAGIQQFAICC